MRLSSIRCFVAENSKSDSIHSILKNDIGNVKHSLAKNVYISEEIQLYLCKSNISLGNLCKNPSITRKVQLKLLECNIHSNYLIFNPSICKDVQINSAWNADLIIFKKSLGVIEIPDFLCDEAKDVINNRINRFNKLIDDIFDKLKNRIV